MKILMARASGSEKGADPQKSYWHLLDDEPFPLQSMSKFLFKSTPRHLPYGFVFFLHKRSRSNVLMYPSALRTGTKHQSKFLAKSTTAGSKKIKINFFSHSIFKPQTFRMDQLVDRVCSDSWRYPLAGMNTSFDEDSSVSGLLRYLKTSDQHTLVSRTKIERRHEIILSDLFVHPTKDGVKLEIVVPVEVDS